MAVSLSALTTSLSSLSFSSHISQRPNTLSFARTESLSVSVSRFPKTPSSLVVSATALAEPETEDLKNYVKSRLPGGFAAQTIIGTGRRKSAIARVVLQEGTGKFIINYRDAKFAGYLASCDFSSCSSMASSSATDDISNSFFLRPLDNPGLNLVSWPLTSDDYSTLLHSMKMVSVEKADGFVNVLVLWRKL
ncbi:30S ribosomal protein S9, chloroplastic [Glycine soja]|uniref:30S ribosomal protein S9, chloroplastic n=1 Tax=Glycine soja TaxID=3848 RepID=A0A445GBP0_GLYSO|nr:30S ribosomal protein S9, chloroplastic [Glycine soja]